VNTIEYILDIRDDTHLEVGDLCEGIFVTEVATDGEYVFPTMDRRLTAYTHKGNLHILVPESYPRALARRHNSGAYDLIYVPKYIPER
jgi:hypothetical protein